jgi:SAM-dependent methyltransferase
MPTSDNYAGFAPFYDLYTEGRDDDLPIYGELAASAPGPVLVLGCGTGRVAFALAERGFKVRGIDSSASMLDIAKSKLDALPENLRNRVYLTQGDMRRFTLGEKFGLIIFPWFGFNYLLTSMDRHSCMRSVKRHLLKGGSVAMDLLMPLPLTSEPVPEFRKRREASLKDGGRVVFADRRTYNPTDRIELREHLFVTTQPDDEEAETAFETQRYYCDGAEIADVLAMHGLEVRHVWGGYDGRHFLEADTNLFVIADLPG